MSILNELLDFDKLSTWQQIVVFAIGYYFVVMIGRLVSNGIKDLNESCGDEPSFWGLLKFILCCVGIFAQGVAIIGTWKLLDFLFL